MLFPVPRPPPSIFPPTPPPRYPDPGPPAVAGRPASARAGGHPRPEKGVARRTARGAAGACRGRGAVRFPGEISLSRHAPDIPRPPNYRAALVSAMAAKAVSDLEDAAR